MQSELAGGVWEWRGMTSQGGCELIPVKDDQSGDKMRHVSVIQEAKLSR